MQAATTQVNCGQREVEVRAWISGASTTCQSGTAQSGYCKQNAVGSNAVVTIQANGCGVGRGLSNRYAWSPYLLIPDQG
jgi:hypothetical protein